MTLKEILREWKRRLDDVASPPLWSNDDGIAYANQACREACERAKLIHDYTTAAVCSIAGKANVGTYTLHPSIIEITSCMWNGRFLTGVSRSQLDEQQNRRVPFGPNPYGSGVAGAVYGHAGFEGGTDWTTLKGSPQFFIDPQEKYLTLIRIPETAAPIKLTAFRYPLEDLVEQTDEPEIPARYHFDLIDWMMHLSYLKRDTETYDAKAADKCEADFVKNFGPKIAANIRRTQRERRSNQVRMNQDW